ncbi:uncharacterized protein B0H64DRAFT_119490 [Chaetomium fimeti]|uniref:CENP-V/GFA domain-containing protein n=1 Tax=Chaetomium fimeti TaxID=1854472 RepID=A0AAE0HJ52_9PEZI|nr:hypothetical protein B0H64DRAFT_119490 [Chaetomium fimeti]
MTTTTQQTITLHAQCLCRAHSFATPPLPTTSLPLPSSSCHCTSCRHLTGALRSSDAPWPGPANVIHAAADADAEGGGTLRRYVQTEKMNILFCGRCGSPLFCEQLPAEGGGAGAGEPEYLAFTGALSVEGDGPGATLPPVVRCVDHIFVGDTLDGGALPWLRGMDGEGGPAAKVWLGGRDCSEEVPAGARWPAVGALEKGYEAGLKTEGAKGDVSLRCHCRGIDLVLRAGEAQREFEETQRRGGELPWYIDPVTHKGMGSLDGCDSCRLAAGSEVYNWTFAALRHISFAGANKEGFPRDTSQLRIATEAKDGEGRDPRLGTLAFYASSPDVQRYFCGRCSATLFYAVDDRPDIVDVAVGLLDSPDGARAESAISWSFGGAMTWRQDMIGTWREIMLHAVEKDAEEWRVERGYPKHWRRVAREEAEKAGEK